MEERERERGRRKRELGSIRVSLLLLPLSPFLKHYHDSLLVWERERDRNNERPFIIEYIQSRGYGRRNEWQLRSVNWEEEYVEWGKGRKGTGRMITLVLEWNEWDYLCKSRIECMKWRHGMNILHWDRSSFPPPTTKYERDNNGYWKSEDNDKSDSK